MISNPQKRKKIQIKSYKNVKHVTSQNSKIIDDIRESLFNNFNLNIIKNKLRIINIYNTGQKNSHRLYNISLGKKFTNGFIRNDHDVLEISDRDFVRGNNSLLLYHFVNTEITFIFHLILRFMHVFKALSEDVFFGFFSMLVHFYFPMLGSFEVIIVVLQDLKL